MLMTLPDDRLLLLHSRAVAALLLRLSCRMYSRSGAQEEH